MDASITVTVRVQNGTNQNDTTFEFPYSALVALNADGTYFDEKVTEIGQAIADGLTELGFEP